MALLWKRSSSSSSSFPHWLLKQQQQYSPYIRHRQQQYQQYHNQYALTQTQLPSIQQKYQPQPQSQYSYLSYSKRYFSVPKKIAIVGSGPSGCYTAKYLQSAFASSKKNNNNDDDKDNGEKDVPHIDILDRLPTAYGLVRNGVAPDHPEVKNVQNDFDKLFFSDDNDGGTIDFYGNVQVGRDVSIQELRELYDIVVLAYGCESDNDIRIPGGTGTTHGSKFKGILSAREFVNWYNGHVDFEWVEPIVQEALLNRKKNNNSMDDNDDDDNIVVIGLGNVALDCARILAKEYNELNPTDITTSSLHILRPNNKTNNDQQQQQRRRNITIVGRRGHVQAAFTIKEVRELTKLPNANFVVHPEDIEAGKSTEASLEELKDSRPKTRIDALLSKQAERKADEAASTRVDLRFLHNPIRFESDDGTHLSRVVCERTKLTGSVGKQSAVGTGVEEVFPADLALVSIGYKGMAIPGTEEFYDEASGRMINVHGLVDSAKITTTGGDENKNEISLGGLYVSGWLKRGPTGIIGTNIADAKDTVATIVKDVSSLPSSSVSPSSSKGSLQELLDQRGVQVINWQRYQKINAAEMKEERKRHPDQPREKLTTRQELLAAAFGES